MKVFDAYGTLGLRDNDLTRGLVAAKAKVAKTMAEIDGMRAEAEIRADSKQLDRELANARRKLAQFKDERATAHLQVDVDKANRRIAEAEKNVRRLAGRKEKIDVELSERTKASVRGLEGLRKNLRKLRGEAEQGEGAFTRLGKALHNGRLTMGPLSLSLRGMMLLLAAAAPIIGGVVAAAGGLAAVLGEAVVGGAGLAGSAMLGFGGVAGGVFAMLAAHPQALKPLKDGMSDIGKEFVKQTHVPRAWGIAVKQGIGFAKDLLPDFADFSEKSLRGVSRGFTDMVDSFRKNDLRGVLFGDGGLLTNAAKATEPLIAGFGDLFQIAARIGQSFGRFFEPIGEGFQKWSSGALQALQDSDSLDSVVNDLMLSLGSVGNFAKESGRTLLKFFVAAGPAGRRMVGDLTDLVSKWGDWLSKAENQKKLNKWLDDGWETMKKLGTALESMAKAFDKVRAAAKPFVDGILDIAGSGIGQGILTAILGGVALSTGLKIFTGLANVFNRIFTNAGKAGNAVRTLGRNLARIPGVSRLPNPFARWKVPKTDFGQGLRELDELQSKTGLSRTARIKATLTGDKQVEGRLRSITKPRTAPIRTRVVADPESTRAAGGAADELEKQRSRSATRAFPKPEPEGRGWIKRFGRGAIRMIPQAAAEMASMWAAQKIGEKFHILDPKRPLGGEEDMRNARNQIRRLTNSLTEAATGKKAFGSMEQVKQANAYGAAIQRAAFKASAGFKALNRTATGKKITMTITASGDKQVRATLMRLAQTKLGRKLLQIVEKGGRPAWNALGRLARTRIGRKLLEILQRGGPQAMKLVSQLGRTKIGRKLLQVIERGGRAAANLVRRLSNAQLRQKVMRILQRGGPQAERQLKKLLGMKNLGTATKSARTRDRATAVLNRIKAMANLGTASKNAKARDQATAVLNRIRAINDLGTATKTIVTRAVNMVSNLPGIGADFGKNAEGREPGERAAQMASAQEIMAAANRAVMMPSGGRVIAATFTRGGDIVGEEGGEWVIPEDPKYRGRALELLADAAERLGISAFAKGKKPRKKSAAQKRAEAKRRRARAKRRRERRERQSDRGYISRHGLGGGVEGITAGVEGAEADAEQAEHDYGIHERRYRTDSEDHPVLNDDGTVNKSNISWHETQLGQLVSELRSSVIVAYQTIRDRVSEAQDQVVKMWSVLIGWDPKSKWGEGKRKDWMEELMTADKSLLDSDRTAKWAIDDRNADAYDLEHEKGVITGTKPSEDAGKGGSTAGDGTSFQEQFGAFNAARNELFQAFGGNALSGAFAQSAFAGVGGSVQAGIVAAFSNAGLGVAGGGVSGGTAGAISALGGGGSAAAALLGGAGGSTPRANTGGAGGAGGAGTVLNQTNNYAAPPPDPHTFSQDVKWELQNAV